MRRKRRPPKPKPGGCPAARPERSRARERTLPEGIAGGARAVFEHRGPEFLKSVSPHHGEIACNVLSQETLKKLAAKFDAMPNGETWYADIYKKAIVTDS